jgi:pimeloyl-ACP methyl ester carboxylesterase
MQDLKYPYPVQRIKLRQSIEIAYTDEGQGATTLLMIHGLGSYLPAWRKNIEGLKHQFRCIAMDLPNYGKSSKGDYEFSMHFFATTLMEFIEKLDLKHVVLIGHSMGAQIAVTLSLESNPSIDKLVLLAPAGVEVFSAEEKAFFKGLVTPANIKDTPDEQIEQNFALNFSNNLLPEDARFMLQDRLLMRGSSKEYDYYCNMVPKCVMGMLDAPIFDQLEKINIPCLILYGNEDLLIPNKILHPDLSTRDIAESGQQKITDSQLYMLSPCGHFVQWECAEEVNNLIEQFIMD